MDVIKDLEMRSSLLRKRRAEDRGEGNMRMEVEAGVRLSTSQGAPVVAGSHSSQQKGMGLILPQRLQKELTLISNFWFPSYQRINVLF